MNFFRGSAPPSRAGLDSRHCIFVCFHLRGAVDIFENYFELKRDKKVRECDDGFGWQRLSLFSLKFIRFTRFLLFSSFAICPFSFKTSLDAWYGICSQLHMCKKREMWFSWLSEHLGHVAHHCNASARALKILSVWFLIEAKVGWWWKSPARQTWAAAQIWLEAARPIWETAQTHKRPQEKTQK